MPSSSLGVIGAGQMGTALAAGFVQAGAFRADGIWAYDPSPSAVAAFLEAIPGACTVAQPQALLEHADTLLLAVKPQHAQEACLPIQGRLGHRLVLSIVAGISLKQLSTWLGTRRVVRIMPNTPCVVSQGASAFAVGEAVSDQEAQWVEHLLQAVGWAVRLPETLLDAVTGLSGSGPAFVAVFIEALADGGVQAGLPRTTAYQLALHTVRGTAELLARRNCHPAELKDQVASPAGTTIHGLAALEEHAFRGAVMQAVTAAAERARQLGERPTN